RGRRPEERAVRRLELEDAADDRVAGRERQLQVFERAEPQEFVVDGSVAAEDRLRGSPGRAEEPGGPLFADRGPAPREGGEVDEVETAAGAERLEPGLDPVDRQFLPERDQPLEREDGVVEV